MILLERCEQLLELTHVAVNRMTEEGLLDNNLSYERILEVAEDSRNHLIEGSQKQKDSTELAKQLGIAEKKGIPDFNSKELTPIEFKRRDGSIY